MKRLLFTILLLCGLLPTAVQASELVKVARVDTRDNIQLYFSFDKTPKFSTIDNQRRIDLIFNDTAAASALSLFSPDEHIVKILPRPKKSEFALSLFFRYQPLSHKLSKSPDGKLVFEVLLGNEFSKAQQQLAKRLKGLTVLHRVPTDQANPAILSPYAKNWRLFFAGYEAPLEIALPVKFTTTPFPIIQLLPPQKELNLEILDNELLDFAGKDQWALVEEKLIAMIRATTDPEKQKLLALTLGETLVRKGDFEKAYIQLHLLKEQYVDEWLGTYANYLLIHLRSIYESPYLADAEFQALEPSVGNSPLAPYFLLSQMETALATDQLDRLNKLLLRDNIAFPKPIAEVVRLRQADYWHAQKQPLKAFAAYQLHKNSPVLVTLPYSLGGYCSALYVQKKYQEAASCYEKLAPIVSDKPLLGLIGYRRNMARLKFTDGSMLIEDFARIEKTYPDTEAGVRASMKSNDLSYLQSQDLAKDQVIERYESISENSIVRSIREESLLKTAIVYAESDEPEKSIPLLRQLLREFQTGDVRISAQALLIQLLPGEIKRLVENKEYVKALVLAKQNKELFEKNWIDSQFLVDTAQAYHRVGLYNDAHRLYLYLMEILRSDQREKYYLPMIRAAFDQGNYNLVEDYAAQYTYNYPKGSFANQLLSIRLEALLGEDRLTDALGLLPSPLPEDKVLHKIAASIHFRLNDYDKCLTVLNKLTAMENPLPQKEQFLLAESLFETGDFAGAEKEFRLVTEKNDFYEQSLFRLANLERKKGNEEKALSFLQEIVEKGSNPRWKQYAVRELQFKSATDRR